MLKSVAVVLGSYILSFPLVFASNPLLKRLFPGEFDKGHVPATNPLIASTACFIVISIFCAWLCARFAPGNPGKHVLSFWILGQVMGIVFTIVGWKSGWPHWYALAWVFSWPVSCWIGLMLLGGRRTAKAAAA